jgi:catechol 2,3-dioxygenase-like lactoylglutathione lyase family enzyme
MQLAGVRLAVDDLPAAEHAYRVLLGVEPQLRDGRPRFRLGRGRVELEAAASGRHAVHFALEGAEQPPDGVSFHGLDVSFAPAVAPHDESPPSPVVEAIDHVVVRSADPDRAIVLWRDRMGLRLALDRAFPERGLRLVFFRSGGMTLEIAAAEPPPAERAQPDHLYGVTYRVHDLESHRERLVAAGLDVSPIRPGMRPGTVVATVRSGTAGVPTLLLQMLPAA